MSFSSSVGRLSERVPWKNSYWNTLIDDIDSAMSSITGSDLAEDIVLTSDQNIDGGDNSIYGFRRYFGFGGTGYCIVDATSYGAGSGFAGDGARLQKAIDDLPDTGGFIFLPPGYYIVEESVWLSGSDQDKSNVVLAGAGPSTVIYTTGTCPNVPQFMMGQKNSYSTGMQIINMRFDGSSTTDGHHAAISLDRSENARVIGCHFEDIEGSGIHALGSNGAMIHKCNFIGMGVMTSDEGCGIYHAGTVGTIQRVSEISKLRITNCHFANNMKNGIRLTGCSNVVIADCTFDQNEEDGILIETLSRSSVKGVIIKNCSFYDNWYDGVAIKARTPGTSIVGVIVSGNTVIGNGQQNQGISLYGAEASPVRFFVINGNVCQDNDDNGIFLRNGVEFGAVVGNVCNNNNRAAGDECGIKASGADGEPVQYVSITGNSCGDDRSAGSREQAYGILLDTYTSNNVCVGNVVHGNASSDLTDNGTDNDVSHNPGV